MVSVAHSTEHERGRFMSEMQAINGSSPCEDLFI